MLRLAIDENFNNDVLRGLQRRFRGLDAIRLQDAGLSGAEDPEILQWAADQERVIVSHDVTTLIEFAYQRVRRGDAMPGLIEVPRGVPIQQAIEDLHLLAELGEPVEIQGRVVFLPFK